MFFSGEYRLLALKISLHMPILGSSGVIYIYMYLFIYNVYIYNVYIITGCQLILKLMCIYIYVIIYNINMAYYIWSIYIYVLFSIHVHHPHHHHHHQQHHHQPRFNWLLQLGITQFFGLTPWLPWHYPS